jgi:glutathione synthase/RimK-type ligase-like ATP-grasp enzyme
MTDQLYYLQSLQCVEQAASNLNLRTEFSTKDKLMLDVYLPNQILRFWRNKNPFSNYTANKICRDKAYQAEIFNKFGVPQPQNAIYHNPKGPNAEGNSISGIVREIEQQFTYPIVLKKHSSSLAKGVHLAQSRRQLKKILRKYFKKNLHRILVVQEFIPGREFRCISYKGKPMLAYEKVSELSLQELTQKGDLNPLHSGRATKVTNDVLLEQFAAVSDQIYKALQANFFGADIIISQDGQINIIEVNSHPACSFYNHFYGQEDFVRIYQTILEDQITSDSEPLLKNQNLHIHQSHHHPLQSSQSDLEFSEPS